ncbi:PAS domain S-box protein [Spirochaeta dissipatitropha]
MKTILLVEDEKIIAMSQQRILGRRGYTVLTAGSGAAAVDAVSENPEIDLILMDIDLGGGMDGVEAAREILSEREIPLVFVSSHTQQDVVDLTESVSPYGYVVKGSGETVLVAAIRMAFRLFESRLKEREALQEIRNSRNLMRYVVEHMRGAVAVHDRDLRYIYVSQQYLEDFRVTETDVIGKHHYEVFPEIPEKWREVHRKALQGIVSSAENDPFERADGKIDWTRWECRPWYEDNGSIGGIIIYTEVITERRNAELLLEKSEERYRELFETLSEGVVYQAADGRIISANPAAERMLGLTLDQMQGKTSMDPGWQMICEDGSPVPGNDHPAMQALASGRTVGPVLRAVRRADSSEYSWFSITATPQFCPGEDAPFQVYAVMVDMNETHRMQIALRDSEERFKALHNASFGGIGIHDKGIILECNLGLSEMTGYSIEELIGMNGLLLIAEEERDYVLSRIAEGHEKPYEATGIRKNGEEYPLRLEARNIPYKGKPVRVVEFRDITEQKQADAQVQRLLQEKETLLRETHHRVKNNMNTVYNLLSLQAADQDDDKCRSILEDAARRIQSMISLYDKLYRSESYRELPVEEFLEPLINEIIELFYIIPEVRVQVECDDFMLSTRELSPIGIILSELITNSMKYAFDGMEAGEIHVEMRRSGETVTCSYSDNGKGLPKHISPGNSSGFGLLLVQLEVQQLCGELEIVRDRGTRFLITFVPGKY